jgi:hypothetical protein
MKKIPNFTIIVITITCIYFISCSKNSSSSKTTLPRTCTNPSDCIVNTWYLKQQLANYNGSVITVFVKGGNANLLTNFDSLYWVITNNEWTESPSPNSIFDAGTWKILPDSTMITNSTYPDTFKIIRITPDTLKLYDPYDHNYPSYPSMETAIVIGLDTAKLSGYYLTFTTTQ